MDTETRPTSLETNTIFRLFSWARIFKWGRKREKQRKRKLASAPSRFASLTERHSGKGKQTTNWSVSTFKGKLKFYRYKIVKYKPQAFNRKILNKANSYFA